MLLQPGFSVSSRSFGAKRTGFTSDRFAAGGSHCEPSEDSKLSSQKQAAISLEQRAARDRHMSSVSFSDASAREEPPRRRMQRTLSTVERDALQSVLDVVERETDSEHTKGMSRFTFFLGLANLVVSAFLLGACTESFWLVYAIQALFIIGLRISTYSSRSRASSSRSTWGAPGTTACSRRTSPRRSASTSRRRRRRTRRPLGAPE